MCQSSTAASCLKPTKRGPGIVPAGSGEVDWGCLDRVCPSELLRFEETAAAALEQLQLGVPEEQEPKAFTQGDRSPSPIFSPRGVAPGELCPSLLPAWLGKLFPLCFSSIARGGSGFMDLLEHHLAPSSGIWAMQKSAGKRSLGCWLGCRTQGVSPHTPSNDTNGAS